MNHLSESQAREKASKGVQYALPSLIHPSDVQEGAESWENVDSDTIRDECYHSAELMVNERQEPFNSLIYDRTLSIVHDDLLRISNELTDILVENGYSEGELVRNHQIQPFNMDKWEAWNHLTESEYPVERAYPSAYIKARTDVIHGIVKGMAPKGVNL